MARAHGSRAVLAAAALAALCALPAPAGATMPGANGRIVFASGDGAGGDAEAKLYLRTAFGSTAGGVVSGPIASAPNVQHRHPTWSPDRTKIAYARGSTTGANFDIFILDLTKPLGSAQPQNITNSNDVTDDRPSWSPDGTRIAFESENANNSNQLNVKIYNVATGITTNFTDQSAGFEHKPVWTPNSQTIYYATGNPSADNLMDIVRQPAGGGTVSNVAAAPGVSEYQPALSADGTRMCFTRGTTFGSADSRVIVADKDGAQQTPLPVGNTGTGYNCTWSPNGNLVAYVLGTFSNGNLVVEASDLSGIPFVPLVETDMRFDGNPDWAPDGKPDCDDITVNTAFNTPVTIPLRCRDTGPEYEQGDVTVTDDCGSCTDPQHGTNSEVEEFTDESVTYTPNQGFSGQDSFIYGGFDFVQFADSATITVNVAGPPGNSPGGAAKDVTASSISAVTLSRRRWRRGSGLPQLSATPRGTTISWRLSEAARTTLTFQRQRPGRRQGRRCLPATPRRKSLRPCKRFVRAGSLSVPNAKAGLNRLKFEGRLTRSRRLALGTYRIVFGAVDAAGNVSRTSTSATFTIVAR